MWYSAATFGDSIKIINAPIAQPVEQRPFKPKVPGSIPGGRTNLKPLCRVVLNLCAHQVQLFEEKRRTYRSPIEPDYELTK